MNLTLNRGTSCRGFTLIELMIVILLIGILTALIIPEMRGSYEDALLRSTARKLVDVFTIANSRAVTIQQPHRVRLDAKNSRYLMERPPREGEKGSGFVPATEAPGAEGDFHKHVSLQIHKSNDDGLPPIDLAGPVSDDAITFYADGTAEAGEVLLRDRDGFGLVLRINPTTARVHITELPRQ